MANVEFSRVRRRAGLLFIAAAFCMASVQSRAADAAAAPTSAPTTSTLYKANPGPHPYQSLLQTWNDPSRNRELPVKIYYPTDLKEPAAVILFSHGLGGTREGYAYLGRHWASWGYIVIHLQHEGSDDSVWRGKRPREIKSNMREAINIRTAIDRLEDVKFAIQQIGKLNAEVPLKGLLNERRIGMAGHSYGAWTTLGAIGMSLHGPNEKLKYELASPEIRAAIAMSSPSGSPLTAYTSIHVPTLHMTGTEDASVVLDTKPEDRRAAFDNINGVDQYLVIFNGGDHMVFSQTPRLARPKKKSDDRFRELILSSTTAFWDMYLRGSGTSFAWLASGGFRDAMKPDGTIDMKLMHESN